MTAYYWNWGGADAERLCVVTRIPGRDNFRGISKAAIFEDNSLVTFEDEEGAQEGKACRSARWILPSAVAAPSFYTNPGQNLNTASHKSTGM